MWILRGAFASPELSELTLNCRAQTVQTCSDRISDFNGCERASISSRCSVSGHN